MDSNKKPKVVACIPAYNEEKYIANKTIRRRNNSLQRQSTYIKNTINIS